MEESFFNIGIIYRNNTWWNIDYICSVLKQHSNKVNFRIFDVTEFNIDNFPNNLDGITLLPTESDVVEPILEKNLSCKWIHCMWSGVDKLLNIPHIMEKDICLTNGRGWNSKSLAEYSIFSMLYFSYNLQKYIQVFNQKGWYKPLNQMINQKTLTIVGYGLNGVEIAKKAKLGFDMKVIGIKKNIQLVEGKEYIDKITTIDKLQDIIPVSDYIINILPGTKETENLWDNKLFSLMKSTAVFINLSRGSSVNEEHLIQVLKEKKILGAALEVFKQEPLSSDSEFYKLENVILSFHSCGNTIEYFKQGVEVFINNLNSYEKTGKFLTIVDKIKGY